MAKRRRGGTIVGSVYHRVRRIVLVGLVVVLTGLLALRWAVRAVRRRLVGEESPAPVPQGVLVPFTYRADFRRWWQGTSAKQHAVTDVVNNAYLWTPLDPLHRAWALPGDTPAVLSPCVATVSTTLATGPPESSYGLMLGHQPGYRAAVFADGMFSVDHVAGDATTSLVWQECSAIRRGADENQLTVTLALGWLSVSINGETVASVPLAETPRGPIHLTVAVSDAVPRGSTTVYFRELTVDTVREPASG